MHADAHTHTHIHTYSYTRTQTHEHIQIFTYTHIHIYTYTHVFSHAHTYMHTYMVGSMVYIWRWLVKAGVGSQLLPEPFEQFSAPVRNHRRPAPFLWRAAGVASYCGRTACIMNRRLALRTFSAHLCFRMLIAVSQLWQIPIYPTADAQECR